MLDDEAQSTIKSVINFRHSLNLDYTLSRGATIGFYGSFTRDGYGVDFGADGPEYSRNLASTSGGIQFKFFKVVRKGAIAPLGNYFGLKVGVNNTKLTRKANPFTLGEQDLEDVDSFVAPAVGFVFGKQTTLHQKLMINVGAECNVPILIGGEYGIDLVGIVDGGGSNDSTPRCPSGGFWKRRSCRHC